MVIPQLMESSPTYKKGYENGFNCHKQMTIRLLQRLIKMIEKEPAFKEYTTTGSCVGKLKFSLKK